MILEALSLLCGVRMTLYLLEYLVVYCAHCLRYCILGLGLLKTTRVPFTVTRECKVETDHMHCLWDARE